jgi:hypothetical protein
MAKRRAVYVEWMDHSKTEEDPRGLKPVKRRTLGWVVKETAKYIVVTMDLNGKAREYGFCIMKSDALVIQTIDLGR